MSPTTCPEMPRGCADSRRVGEVEARSAVKRIAGAIVRMSAVGTKRTRRVRSVMSALRGKAENICSHGAFPVLDPLRKSHLVPHSRYRVAKYPVSQNICCTKPLRGRTGDAVELKDPDALRCRLVDFFQEWSHRPSSGLICGDCRKCRWNGTVATRYSIRARSPLNPICVYGPPWNSREIASSVSGVRRMSAA